MSGPGLTSTGFTAATTTDVQKSIETDELGLIDPALNLSTTQPIGQLNGIFASAASNVWALVAAIYAAIDPGGAIGVQLDNLCALTGCTRLSATKTFVLCTVNLNAGTYAAGTLTANIAGYPQYTFTNRDQIIAPGGSITGQAFLATATGPIAANAGTLTAITAAVAGWISITNPTGGTVGTNIETDTALRLRRATLLVAAPGCTTDAIRAGLLTPTIVPGIIQASVLENNTLVTDGNGQPAKSFQALIWDGPSPLASNVKIAQAIWNSKPSGIQAYGVTSANATDATGKLQAVLFTRVSQLPIYFAITVKTDPSLFPGAGVTLIQNAIAAVMANQVAGATVYALACETAALSVLGVLDVTAFTLDIAPGPVGVSNITLTPFQLATFNSAAVTVT